jgi:signal transduction histidine kinase
MKELRRLKYRFVLIVMAMLFTITSAVLAGIYFTMTRAETQLAVRMMAEMAERDGGAPREPRPDDNDFDPKPVPENRTPLDDVTRRFSGFEDGSPAEFAMFRNSFSIRLDAEGNILSLNSAGGFFQRAGAADAMDALSADEQANLAEAVSLILNSTRTDTRTPGSASGTTSITQGASGNAPTAHGASENGISRSGTLTMDDTDYRYLLAAKPYGQIIVLLDRSLEIATERRLLSTLLLTGGVGLVLLFLVSLFLAERAIVPMRKAWERQKRFIADASHELKTPLTVIAANTDVVLGNRHETVASQAKWLGYIQSETERMSKLVNDLLKIAKLDATETESVMQPLNLSETVTAACLPLESLAFESGRALITEVQPNLTYAGDADSLQQVVGILVDNAIKHASGEGDILVSLIRETETGRMVLSVRNPGAGIPAAEAARIFERFYRPDASRARETGGYGLGLSIAKSVVERHGGTISVRSTPDGQTTFTIVLPHRKGHGVRPHCGV